MKKNTMKKNTWNLQKLSQYTVLSFLTVGWLTGCQTSNFTGLQSDQPIAGKNSFISFWEDISPAESKVSIMVERGNVKARRAKYDPYKNLYSQAFLLSNGSMVYEEQTDVPSRAILTPTEQIVRRYNQHNEILSNKITINEEDVVKKSSNDGDIYYTYIQAPELKCYVFFRYSEESKLKSGQSRKLNSYQAITGSFCGNPETANPETLEVEMLDFLETVKFDNGDSARKEIIQSSVSEE